MFRNLRLNTVVVPLLALFLVPLAGADNMAQAGPLVRLQATGQGVFSPANIGTPQGGTAGVVLGDGSGLAGYQATGTDFRLDGRQLGANTHSGAVQSFTTGTVVNGKIVWPAKIGPNPYLPGNPAVHLMATHRGAILFTYTNPPTRFEFDPTAGVIKGYGDFVVIGGTGHFVGASGLVKVVVTTNLPADVVPNGVRFRYDFDGIIQLRR